MYRTDGWGEKLFLLPKYSTKRFAKNILDFRITVVFVGTENMKERSAQNENNEGPN